MLYLSVFLADKMSQLVGKTQIELGNILKKITHKIFIEKIFIMFFEIS